jgi:hypothetical protein
MALTPTELSDLQALELEIAHQIEEANTKPTVQQDVPRYYAMSGAKMRAAALAKIIGDAVPLPTPTPTPTPAPANTYSIALIGSSSSYRYPREGAGVVNNGVTFSTDGVTFTPMTAGRMCMDAGNAILAATGYGVRWIDGGANGTTLTDWEADGSALRAAAVGRINAAGGCNAALVQVGYNEFAFGGAITYEGFKRKWRSLIAKLRAETNQPGLLIIMGMSQDASDYPAAVQMAREAELAVANNDVNVILGFQTYDLDTYDGIHQTEPSQAITGARFAAQYVAVVKNQAQHRGPYVTAATPVSSTITDVTIAHRYGTDFTAAAQIPGFVLVAANGARNAAVGTKLSATTIRLTHADRLGASWQLAYAPDAGATDNAGVLRDNGAPPLPLEVTERTFIVGDFALLADMQAKTAFRSGVNSDPTPADWNRLGGGDYSADLSMPLNNPAGQPLGWSIGVDLITATSNQGAVTGNNTGRVVDSVLQHYFFNGNNPSGGAVVPVTSVTWRGLNPAWSYSIEALGSRAAATRNTIFTIDGIAINLDCAQNTSRFVTFTGRRPKPDGTITMTFERQPDQLYGYINYAIIRKE